jgi:MPBQ/MSBQ methyltransferase
MSVKPRLTARQRMVRIYDRTMNGRQQNRFYENSGFYNFGYWDPPTDSMRHACESLVDKLAEKIPGDAERILDVACGLGASTRRLSVRFAPNIITAINISEAQLALARERAPGSTFLFMDATALQFPDASFDAVICVEAAFHFDTREVFFQEALRVLKPGGWLVLSDILLPRFMVPFAVPLQIPRANFVKDIPSYRKQLQDAGFEAIDVQNATDVCLGEFRRYLANWPAAEHQRGQLSFRSSIPRSIVCHLIAGYFGLTCKSYLLASARKRPGDTLSSSPRAIQ